MGINLKSQEVSKVIKVTNSRSKTSKRTVDQEIGKFFQCILKNACKKYVQGKNKGKESTIHIQGKYMVGGKIGKLFY